MNAVELLLLDLDGTLAVKWESELLPGRVDELRRLDLPVAIVTNQGGVHARHHWESMNETARASRYPTVDSILQRLETISREVPQIRRAYVAFYVGHSEYVMPAEPLDVRQKLDGGLLVHGTWDPGWRKPAAGMLRQACCDLGVDPQRAMMLGDSDDDREAARNAGGMPFVRVGDARWREGFLD